MEISIEEVMVGERKRELREDTIPALMESVRTSGLIHPITVTQDRVLVAGLHRLEACRRLHWTDIPCVMRDLEALESELIEIDENLVRNDLKVLERCGLLKRRKEIYEAKDHRTKAETKRLKGLNVSDEIISSLMDAPPTFTQDTATKTGFTSRTIQQEVQIATKLDSEAKEKLRKTDIADNKTELLRLSRLEPEEQREIATKLANKEASGVKQARVQIQAQEIRREAPPLPTGPFRVIVVDPPWSYDNRAADATHRSANPYPGMTIEQIKALPILHLAADDAVLWMWTTNAHIPAAFQIVQSWGFSYKTLLTWFKDRMGTGDWLRGKTEHCLFAVRGKPTITLTNQTTAISGPLREHSRKPDQFYELVEELCPGSKVELFQREERKGWIGHGDQTGLFQG